MMLSSGRILGNKTGNRNSFDSSYHAARIDEDDEEDEGDEDLSDNDNANNADNDSIMYTNTTNKRIPKKRTKSKMLWTRIKQKAKSLQKSNIGGERNTMLLLEEHEGLPIKEAMKTLYSVRRLKFVWEILVLTLTLGLFYLITSLPLDRRTAYEQELTVIESIQDEEFASANYKKNFLEIRSPDEFWQWVEGPLLSALYSTDPSTPPYQQDYMNQYLRLVGGVQIRQFRVRSNSCQERRRLEQWQHKVDTKDESCFAGYGEKEANKTKPFWATGVGDAVDSSDLVGHWGHCPPQGCTSGFTDEVLYGTGGFYLDIPPSSHLSPYNKETNTTAANIVRSLKDGDFFDRGTRAVAVELIFFNTNTEIMTTARFIIEQFPSGLIEASSKYRHVRLSILSSKTDIFRTIICEGVYLMLLVYLFKREVRRMCFTRPVYRYFLNPFSYLEIFFFVFHAVFIAKWYQYVFFSKRKEFDVMKTEFVSYYDMAHDVFITYQFAGFAFLAGIFKLMRFFSLNRRVAVMWQAIWDSAPDLVAFIFSFLLLLFGFGYLAHMMWGSHTQTFTTFYNSVTSLFRFWVDDFPFMQLYETNPDTYYYFFIPFALLITLIVQNIFVAIIINAFSVIHAESKDEHWKHDLPGLFFEIRKRFMLTLFHCRYRCKIRVCWYSYRYICCCCCCRYTKHEKHNDRLSRWSLDELIDEREHHNIALQMLGARSLSRHLVWARELEFYHILAISARHARRKTMSGGTIPSLYEYFRRAYREHGIDEAPFMSLHELCAITHPRHLDRGHGHTTETLRNCDHT